MIKGMARTGRRLGLNEAIDSAQKSLDFIRTDLWRNKRLYATWREKMPKLNGYLDDYAFLAEGILELLQARWRTADVELLKDVCDAMLDWFEDRENGGFFFTSHDHEKLIHRPKPGPDDAIPSANGIAVRVLWRAGLLLSDSRYLDAAARTLLLFANEITNSPSVYACLTLALHDTQKSCKAVIIRGPKEAAGLWMHDLNKRYLPEHVIFMIPEDTPGLPPPLAQKTSVTGSGVAYVCDAPGSSAAITDLLELKTALEIKQVLHTNQS